MLPCNGLFTLPDSDSNCKPHGYIVLCRTFHSAWNQISVRLESGSESESGSIDNINKP